MGCLVDMSLQNTASSYVAQKVGLFTGTDGQRLAAAFADPAYEEALSRAIEQEAYLAERQAAKMAAQPDGANPAQSATIAAYYQEIANSERQLAKALGSSSEDAYKAWLHDAAELETSNPFAKGVLGAAIDNFVEKAQRAEVNRAMVVAGLAIAQEGTGALQSHTDPTSGKPRLYIETPDGFELQSTYQMNDKPMYLLFKQR